MGNHVHKVFAALAMGSAPRCMRGDLGSPLCVLLAAVQESTQPDLRRQATNGSRCARHTESAPNSSPLGPRSRRSCGDRGTSKRHPTSRGLTLIAGEPRFERRRIGCSYCGHSSTLGRSICCPVELCRTHAGDSVALSGDMPPSSALDPPQVTAAKLILGRAAVSESSVDNLVDGVRLERGVAVNQELRVSEGGVSETAVAARV